MPLNDPYRAPGAESPPADRTLSSDTRRSLPIEAGSPGWSREAASNRTPPRWASALSRNLLPMALAVLAAGVSIDVFGGGNQAWVDWIALPLILLSGGAVWAWHEHRGGSDQP